MENSTYVSKFQEMFPNIEPIIQGDALAIFSMASSTGLQERYVTKSEKLIELEKEKELVQQLKEKSDLLWNKISQNAINQGEYRYKIPAEDPNLPHICCRPLEYSKYREDGIWGMISSIAAQSEELNAYPQYWELARRISCNVDGFFENISVAFEQENKGRTGEDAVVEYIKCVSTSKILQNVVLPAPSGNAAKTAESDLVIVTANGVYVCEVKSYGKAGQTLHIDKDGNFRKLDSRGNKLKDYASPFEQNDYHCRAIHYVLQDSGISGVPIHPVIVVSNTDVDIQNSSGMLVVDTNQLGDTIRRAERADILSDDQMSAVYSAIKRNRIEERAFPILGVSGAVYDMYDFCLGALLHYAEQNDNWASDCSKRLTEWATACNMLWEEANQQTVIEEKAAMQKQNAEMQKREKRKKMAICVACVLVLGLIIWLVYTFWEQILAFIGLLVIVALFYWFLGLYR